MTDVKVRSAQDIRKSLISRLIRYESHLGREALLARILEARRRSRDLPPEHERILSAVRNFEQALAAVGLEKGDGFVDFSTHASGPFSVH